MGSTEAPARDRATASCVHCGLPVPPAPPGSDGPPQFCCAGCRTVHALIRAHGLDRYYALRGEADRAPAPARPSGRSYAELDDAAFQSSACRSEPHGLVSTSLYLEGVHCAACVWLVEKLPHLLPGVAEIRLDLPRSQVVVRWDPASVRLSEVARQLDSLGYPPHPCRGSRAQERERREDRVMLGRIGLAGAVAGNVMAIAFALYGGALNGMEPEFEGFFRWASLLIALPSVVWSGGVFFRGAWTALGLRALSMDLPISLGLLAGFVQGALNTVRGVGDVYFDSVTALIFLLLVGRYLQRRQQRRAADAAELLASLTPSTARLLEEGGPREIPVEALVPGVRVEVRSGELIPADGIVVEGRSTLDASLLSGESRPLSVGAGDRVHAGTLNLSSRLEVLVESTGEASRVGRLLKLVDEHARRRAPIVQLADRLSGGFVAAVLVLAALTLALWLRLDPSRAVDHAVALLIVTCPCALGLATPLALNAAIGQAARAGLLIKGGDVLEKLSRPGRMWLDKTGTLTVGRARLVRWTGDERARPLVAAAEAHSSHSLARALVAALGSAAPGPVEVRETHGGGIQARVGIREVIVGSPDFVGRRVHGAVPAPLGQALDGFTAEALTPVLVAVDGQVTAAAGLGDPLREDAAPLLRRVGALGWRVGVLSGDHPAVVAAAGRRLALDPERCRGGVAPEEKARVVAAGTASEPVVMVGDGVNDAAALAAATVGIAVHGGAEAALAASDVFVARGGVASIAMLLEGSRRAMRVVRRNLVFSLLYNVVGVSLAIAGLLSPLVAAVLMPLSSLTVIASSYRARVFPAPEGAAPCR